MTERRDYYRVLHVHPDAPDEIIKVSYRTLMQRLRMHPDLGGDPVKATLINEAFRTVGHPERRAAYDQWLKTTVASEGARATAPAPKPSDAPVTKPRCHFCATPHEPGYELEFDRVCSSCGASLFPAKPFENDEETRRAIERLPRNMLVVFAAQSPNDTPCRGVTQDISLTGMRFLTSAPLGINDRLLVETEFCSGVAIVRSARQHAVKQNDWEIGVQFLTMRLKRQRGGLISTVA